MRITTTNANRHNGSTGSRVSIYAEINDQLFLVDRFNVPKRNGTVYCTQHVSGKYGQRYATALKNAKMAERTKNTDNYSQVDRRYRIVK